MKMPTNAESQTGDPAPGRASNSPAHCTNTRNVLLKSIPDLRSRACSGPIMALATAILFSFFIKAHILGNCPDQVKLRQGRSRVVPVGFGHGYSLRLKVKG